MTELQQITFYSLISGSTIFLGGLLSYFFGKYVNNPSIKAEVTHGATAFGGGILTAAVGLVLVPEGIQVLNMLPIIVCFSAGTISFFFLDRFVESKGGAIAQLLSMLSDFIPESIAMGAVFVQNIELGILLAVIMAIQNLPEAFNAYLELQSRFSATKSLVILCLLSFVGLIASLSGYYFFSDMPRAIAALMLFAGGGVTYLIFQDIAPLSRLNKSWIPALSASAGFLVGVIGVKILA